MLPCALLSSLLATTPQLDAGRLAKLFGLAPPQPRAVLPPPPSTTALPRLLGTLRAGRGPSLVSLEVGGRARTATPGDVLEGWRLEEILRRDCVRLAQGERAVTICTGGGVGPSLGVAPAPVAALGVGVGVGPSDVVRLERAALRAAVDRDAPQVLQTTRVVPAFRDGRLAGLTLHFPTDSPLTALGLQPRDTLRRVNGKELTPTEAAALWSQWADLAHVVVEVERGGLSRTLTIDVY